MTKILTYKMFESMENDEQILLNVIIPFSIKKYYELSKWAKKKIKQECPQLKQIFVTIHQDKWEIVFVSPELRDNKAFILIQDVLYKVIREECIKNNIEFYGIITRSIITKYDLNNKYILYDAIKNEQIKYENN
jgi:hypothetical protein